MSGPVRTGDAIRRPAHRRSGYVGDVLRHLAATGFTAPARYDEGRQTLAFIESEMPAAPFLLSGPDPQSATAAAAGRVVTCARMWTVVHRACCCCWLRGDLCRYGDRSSPRRLLWLVAW
ncbi:hypothetical protein Ait01nite_056580 [Actinoplanes italicus]|nr:hypothetical protein Ait01nite_056580 [Actinoplanes italicus]